MIFEHRDGIDCSTVPGRINRPWHLLRLFQNSNYTGVGKTLSHSRQRFPCNVYLSLWNGLSQPIRRQIVQADRDHKFGYIMLFVRPSHQSTTGFSGVALSLIRFVHPIAILHSSGRDVRQICGPRLSVETDIPNQGLLVSQPNRAQRPGLE